MHKTLPTPDIAAACNQTGLTCFRAGQFAEAADFFKKATKARPEFVEAWYNLGLTYKRMQQKASAQAAFEETLSLRPDHPAARFHLASLIMEAGNYATALPHFESLVATWPHHGESLSNLAGCYLRLHQPEKAKDTYEKALALLPDDCQILFNLGVIHAGFGSTDTAIRYYQKAILADPDFFDAHYNLALLFMAIQQAAFAMDCLTEALRLQPNNTTVAHLLNALREHTLPEATPAEYITQLFDSYADHYETHLLTALDYQLPALFAAAVKNTRPDIKLADILDLGCGTGLCGLAFEGLTRTLDGVDLSEKMLDEARKKNIYRRLSQSNIPDFLSACEDRYDLIIAGDVLVYFGSLDELIQQAHRVLRPHGIFVFNTEISPDKDYRIRPSGRFGHSAAYLARLAERYGFKLICQTSVMSRLQHDAPVEGYLCVFERPDN